jgi:MoaA/NifB/PqqE/SkfB family radical SAM enzyme
MLSNFFSFIWKNFPQKKRRIIRNFLNNNKFTSFYYNRYRKNKIIENIGLTDLIIYANNFCNAHCGFCDVTRVDYEESKALGIGRPLIGTPVYMSTDLFKKIISDDFISNQKLFVNFLMTEPLLSKNIGEMLSLSKLSGHVTKITTNGFLLEKRASDICENLDHIQISIDGPKELHDSIRGKNFFDKAIQGIKILRDLNSKIKIEINITITSLNYLELYNLLIILDQIEVKLSEVRFQFIDFVSEKMSKHQNHITPLIPQSVSAIDSFDYLNIDIDKLFEQLELIRSYKSRNILKITSKPFIFDKKILRSYLNKDGDVIGINNKCSTPYTQLAINTSGNVYWHMRCFNDYILGNINNNSLKKIWLEGEKANYFRREFEKNNLCFPACTRCCGIMETGLIN